ncbi:type II toxin-antitoxin system Phd/YefM family antitoxin [Thermodesulfobacteriota bacterium]
MGTVTAKHLKQKTGEIIKRVKSGESLTITHWGKPVAIMRPPTDNENEVSHKLSSFDEAWSDIEKTLKKTKPEFTDWKEASKWARNKT